MRSGRSWRLHGWCEERAEGAVGAGGGGDGGPARGVGDRAAGERRRIDGSGAAGGVEGAAARQLGIGSAFTISSFGSCLRSFASPGVRHRRAPDVEPLQLLQRRERGQPASVTWVSYRFSTSRLGNVLMFG